MSDALYFPADPVRKAVGSECGRTIHQLIERGPEQLDGMGVRIVMAGFITIARVLFVPHERHPAHPFEDGVRDSGQRGEQLLLYVVTPEAAAQLEPKFLHALFMLRDIDLARIGRRAAGNLLDDKLSLWLRLSIDEGKAVHSIDAAEWLQIQRQVGHRVEAEAFFLKDRPGYIFQSGFELFVNTWPKFDVVNWCRNLVTSFKQALQLIWGDRRHFFDC